MPGHNVTFLLLLEKMGQAIRLLFSLSIPTHEFGTGELTEGQLRAIFFAKTFTQRKIIQISPNLLLWKFYGSAQ